MTRYTALLLLALPALAGCPTTISGGIECGVEGKCADGMFCGTDNICHDELCNPACPPDQRCNYDSLECEALEDGGATDDTRAHVGFVRGAGASVLGTVISPHAVLTCAGCLGATPATSLSFESRGQAVPVVGIAKHPMLDLAVLDLELTLPPPQLDIAATAPMSGVSYAVVAPAVPVAASSPQKKQYLVTVQATGDSTFDWTGGDMASELLCAMIGGPSFAAGPSGRDVLVGLHAEAGCSGGATQDVRVDVAAAWIAEQIEIAEPDTCPASGTCAGNCGAWSCDDASGTVVETCTADESKCAGNQHCETSSMTCELDAVCTNGTTRVVAGQCGVQTCSGGQWGNTTATSSRCTNGSFPVCSANAGYSCVCSSGQTLSQGECGVKTCSGGSYGTAVATNAECSLSEPTCNASTLKCDCNAGMYRSCGGDGCARNYCAISTGDYNGCSPYDALCDGDATCNLITSSVWVCQ